LIGDGKDGGECRARTLIQLFCQRQRIETMARKEKSRSRGKDTMASKMTKKASSEYLRLAQAHLICRVDPAGDLGVKCTPYIRQIDIGTDQVLDEGYDPHHSPLGSPVYWRVINRGDEQFYCSTFLATRAQVMKGWGTPGLAYCDPITGMAIARIETNLLGDWPPIHDREIVKGSGRKERENGPREIANATGCSPVQFKVREEGFSLRELMQALKLFDGSPGQLPEELLVSCFERYYRSFLGQPELISRTAEVLAIYRREPPMASEEHARAILDTFGVKILDAGKPEDMKVWKEVSGAREH
jgi:hypothetical protein